MSHTMNIKIELHDLTILERACLRMNAKFVSYGNVKLFGGSVDGASVHLPGWQYPIVVRNDGTVSYDNYNGHWGNIDKLHELEAVYGLEKATQEASLKGYLTEEIVEENELVLRITIPE